MIIGFLLKAKELQKFGASMHKNSILFETEFKIGQTVCSVLEPEKKFFVIQFILLKIKDNQVDHYSVLVSDSEGDCKTFLPFELQICD
jgi:hypothetical protein